MIEAGEDDLQQEATGRGAEVVPTGDLLDQSSLIAALETCQPDEVYNLGAVSFVALSFKQATLTGEITGLGVVRMPLRSSRSAQFLTRIRRKKWV